MAPTIVIRSERPGDGPTIDDIVRRAYAAVPYSDHREHLMIERLRGSNGFVPSLSLLAEVDGAPAGHILLTKAHIRDGATRVETLALAPLSVVPERQGQGVGRALVEAGHAEARRLGFGSIVLVGIPDYYPRFGYEPLGRYPITLPFTAPDENCLVLPLQPDALAGVKGVVDYAPGWLDH